MVPNMF